MRNSSAEIRLAPNAVDESHGFDAGILDRSYSFLDDCPDRILDELIRLPGGNLETHVRGAMAWRTALLEGYLPPDETWPERHIAAPVRRALGDMKIARFCKGQAELVDDLLIDIIESFSEQHRSMRSEVSRRLRELEALERSRRRDNRTKPQTGAKVVRSADPVLDRETLRRLREQAERDVAGRVREADAHPIAGWGEQVRAWADISEVFGDLGALLGRGRDMTLGVLRHTGWRDLMRLRELVARLPQLAEVVGTLGRLQTADEGESVSDRVFEPVRRLEEELGEARTPLVPAETRGVERSGSVERMLPGEAALLGHPKLRLLWHAKRAERALLAYRVEGTEIERTLVEREIEEPRERRRQRRDRGPILAVIDTSGSMHGLPERVAKALVLEALRTAHSEKRRCRVYAFSGPGQLAEHELDVSPDGIGELLGFLGLSFGGGSDPSVALSSVAEKIEGEEWAKADVLVVSDGEWPAPLDLDAPLQRCRDNGTRFHGMQIGNRGRTGLHDICDPVHVFTDWANVESGG